MNHVVRNIHSFKNQHFNRSIRFRIHKLSLSLPHYMIIFLLETLTGTSFEMRVPPVESVLAVKTKLQQLEVRHYYISISLEISI